MLKAAVPPLAPRCLRVDCSDDGSTQELEDYKASSGLADRTDIVTFFDYYEVDEGRKP